MRVYELLTALTELPAGAEVLVFTTGDDSTTYDPIVRVDHDSPHGDVFLAVEIGAQKG